MHVAKDLDRLKDSCGILSGSPATVVDMVVFVTKEACLVAGSAKKDGFGLGMEASLLILLSSTPGRSLSILGMTLSRGTGSRDGDCYRNHLDHQQRLDLKHLSTSKIQLLYSKSERF